ncbi:hypothetical protein IV203_014718 [Nitzschia inconspicua]|uniref:Uncharacterized protein n=1 Tax=Nitzschia inconspicua TaxID=303405 RepID=A0A9K3LBE6_9STRA|nr:hypothetical protein IV203_014718 [Nitzschia inconspicua]
MWSLSIIVSVWHIDMTMLLLVYFESLYRRIPSFLIPLLFSDILCIQGPDKPNGIQFFSSFLAIWRFFFLILIPLLADPSPKMWLLIPVIEGYRRYCMAMYVLKLNKTSECGLPCCIQRPHKPNGIQFFSSFLAIWRIFSLILTPLLADASSKVWLLIPVIEGFRHFCMAMYVLKFNKTLECGLPFFLKLRFLFFCGHSFFGVTFCGRGFSG